MTVIAACRDPALLSLASVLPYGLGVLTVVVLVLAIAVIPARERTPDPGRVRDLYIALLRRAAARTAIDAAAAAPEHLTGTGEAQ